MALQRAVSRGKRLTSTRNNQRLEDPVVRDWMNYYRWFYRSKCVQVLDRDRPSRSK